MFCSKCGTQLPDGAAFCPNCGASNPLAQAGAQQPAQPMQQPVQQGAQNVYYQQPMQQPMQGGYQQGWQQSSVYPSQGMAYGAPKRKSPLVKIVALVAVLAIAVFAVVKFTPAQGAIMRSFAPPKKYYHYVEKDSVKKLSTSVSSGYKNMVKNTIAAENPALKGTLTLRLGEQTQELLAEMVGPMLSDFNEGEDFSWLDSAALSYDFNRKDDFGGMKSVLLFNDKNIISMDWVFDLEGEKVWFNIPELSDKYIESSLSEMDIEGAQIRSLFNMVTPMDMNSADPVMQALPDAEVMDKLLQKYLTAIVECIDEVEKKKGELSVEDVSADYTLMISTIDGEAMQKIVEKVCPMLKDDKDVRKLIIDISEAQGEDGEKSYEEFVKELDSMLDSAEKIPDAMKSDIVMTVYTDNKGEVHGRVIESGEDTKIELLMPEKDGKFGMRLAYTEKGKEQVSLAGSGKRNGDKLTGEMLLTMAGHEFGIVGLDAFDDAKLKEGCLLGGVTFTPSKEYLDALAGSVPESVKSLLDDLVIRFDMDTSSKQTNFAASLLSGKNMLASLSLENAVGSGKGVSKVSGGVDEKEWAEQITLDKLEKVVEAFEKAGVPTAYTDLLDQYLNATFE